MFPEVLRTRGSHEAPPPPRGGSPTLCRGSPHPGELRGAPQRPSASSGLPHPPRASVSPHHPRGPVTQSQPRAASTPGQGPHPPVGPLAAPPGWLAWPWPRRPGRAPAPGRLQTWPSLHGELQSRPRQLTGGGGRPASGKGSWGRVTDGARRPPHRPPPRAAVRSVSAGPDLEDGEAADWRQHPGPPSQKVYGRDLRWDQGGDRAPDPRGRGCGRALWGVGAPSCPGPDLDRGTLMLLRASLGCGWGGGGALRAGAREVGDTSGPSVHLHAGICRQHAPRGGCF